jgi:hypothetical protein
MSLKHAAHTLAQTHTPTLYRLIFPWSAIVQWDELHHCHYTRSFNDALDWARYYPRAATVLVCHKKHGIVAVRKGL